MEGHTCNNIRGDNRGYYIGKNVRTTINYPLHNGTINDTAKTVYDGVSTGRFQFTVQLLGVVSESRA